MSRLLDDAEDDLTLPQRPQRPRADYRNESRSEPRAEMRGDGRLGGSHDPDREFTLSTGTVLALFFGLALICAIFFGFGYSMGRKSAQSAATASSGDSTTTDTPVADVAQSKPAAGSPAIQPIPGYLSQGEADASNKAATSQSFKVVPPPNSSGSVTVPLAAGTPAPSPKPRTVAPAPDPDGQIVESPRPVAPSATRPAAASTPIVQTTVAGTPVANGPSYVQIAAVSHQEDADVLLSALRRRGYSVFTRTSDSDKLIHVQVGPFTNKKDADAMRQKLLGDGYNAIVK